MIRGGAIGDFILTLPAISALRQQFPETTLEVLGYPHIVELAMAGGLVDRAEHIEAAGLASFFARNGKLSESIAEYFSEFDVIVSYLYDPDEIFRTNVGRCSPAQFIAGPHRPDEAMGIPASQVYLKPLERLAIFNADPVPRLAVKPAQVPERQLVLHPGSGSPRKNWAESNWSELLQLLVNETTLNLLLAGGEAEGERLQRLAATLPPARTRVAQSRPLARLASLLQSSVGFVGHDSGVTHLAAALGLPGLVLWGETVESIWRPPSTRMRVLRASGGLPNLTVKEVAEQVFRLWPEARS